MWVVKDPHVIGGKHDSGCAAFKFELHGIFTRSFGGRLVVEKDQQRQRPNQKSRNTRQ